MRASRRHLRRLILGMSVEDAQSKFDSPESRSLLRVAHERHNQGILHELQIAQQQRNRMPPEKKCHISRYTKPSVRGFQGYLKQTPDDFVVAELWHDDNKEVGAAPSSSSSASRNKAAAVDGEDAEVAFPEDDRMPTETGPTSRALAVTTTSPAVVAAKVTEEKTAFSRSKETVLETLRDALDNVKNSVLAELADRRQSGALIAGQQPSVVERLVGEASESVDKGYKTLSSSTHLLEPVEMELTLYAKRDKDIADAFRSPLLTVPAREGDISYSLWVAGGLIADDETTTEFPYHIAKYVVASDGGAGGVNRLPRVDVEVYFSPELYQLQRSIGKEGLTLLRKFIGTTMMHQHEPTPVSSTLLLTASREERALLNLFDPSKTEAVRIPWIRKTRSLVSTRTGVAFSVEDAVEENATIEKMKESVGYVWRAWGHLIKDLHVHGDLDFLYVAIDRRKEVRENTEYIQEVRALEEAEREEKHTPELTEGDASSVVASARSGKAGTAVTAAGRKRGGTQQARQRQSYFCPLPADFAVVECLLERKGLPHNMVMEDLTEMLTEMQAQSMEMMRLAVVEELEQGEESGAKASDVVPVLYAPKVVITHAGVIENRTHSFQRIRIRGSTLAHVEALIAVVNDSDYFTSRMDRSPGNDAAVASPSLTSLALPKNLAFSATHEAQTAALLQRSERIQGHQAPTSSTGAGPGRFSRRQTSQALDFMTVSDEEREFWRENYYHLSEPRVIFQDRVDPGDLGIGDGASGKPTQPSPRLLEHLNLVSSKFTVGGTGGNADDDNAAESSAHASSAKAFTAKGKKAKRRNKRKSLDVAQISREKMFEYLCTDMEAETSQYDLRVGDCLGYVYRVNVQRIPSKHMQLVPPAVQSVATKGFINYFGPNRFATYTKMNMHPGLHLLKGEFRAAAHVIVQQFYVDIAMEAEKRRTGFAFPQSSSGANGSALGFHLNDFTRRGASKAAAGGGRRSVAENGTALQKVLSNALQASLLMAGGDGDADAALDGVDDFAPPPEQSSQCHGQQQRGRGQLSGLKASELTLPPAFTFAGMIGTDPCADAFLNVIGPNACHILIHEFLSFLWNDIVNQRLQRYGTFSILPGDLVRKHPNAPRHSAAYAELTRVSRRDIESGRKAHWDVVLPIPGANIELPENHTTDLYVVTLKRMGLHFNPELRQWECFYPKQWQQQAQQQQDAAAFLGSSSSSSSGGSGGGVPLTSPYRFLSTSYQLMEEELGFQTPFTEPLPKHLSTASSSTPNEGAGAAGGGGASSSSAEVFFDPEVDGLSSALTGSGGVGSSSAFDAAGLRPDLQRQHGNPLNLLVEAGYRHPLYRPGPHLHWQFSRGAVGDPHQRWGLRCLSGGLVPGSGEPRKILASSSSSSSSSSSLMARAGGETRRVALPVGAYLPSETEDGQPQLVLPSFPGAQALTEKQQQQRTLSSQPFAAVPRGRGLAASGSSSLALPSLPSRWKGRKLPIPKTPYWLSLHDDACLTLDFQLPTGTYASMLLRELTKMDVNLPEIVDVDRPRLSATAAGQRAKSWESMTTDQQEVYRKYLARRRQRSFTPERPHAVSLALLHQQIFRSGGVRGSLIPTLRSYDSVAK